MSSTPALPTNVVRFRGPVRGVPTRIDQRRFLDAIYAARSLAVAAGDGVAKRMAARFAILGFVVIDEVEPDGAMRRLRPSECVGAESGRVWRVSKRPLGPEVRRVGGPA